MTTPRASLEDTIALLRGQIGVSWPNPWWPEGVPAFNDCAAFQSWGLFGLNGDQPYQTVVSGLIERSGLEFHAGNVGIQRGDLLGLRWSAQVNYDHIGMALGPPNAAGVVQTIDANGGTNKVALSTRSVRNVHNFARPNYPATSTAGGGSTSLDNLTQGEDMDTRYFKMAGSDDWSRIGPDVLPVGTFTGGYEATADVDVARPWGNQYGGEGAAPIELPRDQYLAQQKFGAQEYAAHQAALAKIIATNAGASGGATPDQIAAAVDATLKDDFAALAKVEGTNQAALLAAISQVDENTLATFGLKRV
jgi:hypothetical protein